MKQKFYRLTNIEKKNAQYNILLGERSNGKSYAVKEKCLSDAWNDQDKKFILLRRWDLEIKPNLSEAYFKDAPISVITKNECDGVSVYNHKIFLTRFDEKTNKNVKIKHVGYTMALTMEQHYTSGVYTDVKNVIFEEFISRDYYLPQEPQKLMQLISTVARRETIKVYMIGNTISRLCPYFTAWNLRNIPKQKQGSIDTYSYKTDQINNDGTPVIILIAVEFCENSGHNSTMFFGSASKMITGGAWQTEELPTLEEPLYKYSEIYHLFIKVMNFTFFCHLLLDDNGGAVWYVEPKTTPIHNNERVITDDIFYIVKHPYATKFEPLSMVESEALQLMRSGKICYSDNLTGSDFRSCIKTLTIS